MPEFINHTTGTAPADSIETMNSVQSAWGMVPNLVGTLAESPTALKATVGLLGALEAGTFSPEEQQIIAISASRVNSCGYCVAAHSAMATALSVDAATISSARDGSSQASPKLEALRRTAEALVLDRGHLTPAATDEFFGAGYSQAQLLELIVWIGVKTITNYTNHVADIALDEVDQPMAWESLKVNS